jgi:acetyl esterase/lipase
MKMPSIQSQLFLLAIKGSLLLMPRSKRLTRITSVEDVMAFRQQVEDGAARAGKLPANITISPVEIGELYAEWITPPGAQQDQAILYFHGGGYVSGSCVSHRRHVAKFALGSGVRALQFQYRLAPEHPFPAALDDALAAYEWLLAEGPSPARTVFAGDSAGAGLMLAALLALKSRGLPLPAAGAALSPWTDLKCTGESLVTRKKVDPFTPDGAWDVFSACYTAGQNAGSELISPLYGDLAGLPPLFICAGDHDVLIDDSTRFAEKARAAGVEVTLKVGEGLFHCYPALAPLFPEATEDLNAICAFLREHVGSATGVDAGNVPAAISASGAAAVR